MQTLLTYGCQHSAQSLAHYLLTKHNPPIAMRNDLIVSKSIDIHASPSKVWHILTTPESIKEYLFGTETITDWKVGNEIIFQGGYEDQTYRDKGIILENMPNQLISYSYWSGFSGLEDKPENYSIITYHITQKAENLTEFTWTQQGYANEDVYNHSASGMSVFLEQIKEIAER